MDFDIVICGAGLMGLTLANALRDAPFSIAVVDTRNAYEAVIDAPVQVSGNQLQSGYLPRVSALNIATIELLQRLDVWPEVNRFCQFGKMSVRDARGTASIEFNAGDIQQDFLGCIVENQQVLYALAQKLEAAATVSVLWNQQVTGLTEITALSHKTTETGYQLSLADGRRINCQLLVGADGGSSQIRALSNMQSMQWSYAQEAFVTTIQTEFPHDQVARQWFTDRGALAFLPLADKHLCSIVWSVADPSDLKVQPASKLCHQLGLASEFELGRVLAVDQRFSFPLRQQHSFRYIKSNLALIGDAAHTIHPLAGQGANLGFADARALANELMQAKFETGLGGYKLLRRYERARRADNLLLMSAMEILKRLYDTNNPGIGWLRNTGMAFVNEQQVLKSMLTRLASGH
ncbi:MAG: FAD-dependent monooxygenase [Pseudomonadales bacterium]|nr:FAD-dependent monooxygenase [Pseudomonadales bacterium]